MPLGDGLSVALKEWDVVCRALAEGRQVILLRKGGIYESAGEFEVEHRRFVFFPTFLHQKPDHLKPAERERCAAAASEPSQVKIELAGEVTDIIQLQSRSQMDALEGQHIWAPSLVDMRFNYRPENPLYLLIVRASRLAEPVAIENTPAYAGCKSWVPLEQAINVAGATPVLDEAAYESRRQLIRSRLG